MGLLMCSGHDARIKAPSPDMRVGARVEALSLSLVPFLNCSPTKSRHFAKDRSQHMSFSDVHVQLGEIQRSTETQPEGSI